MPTVVCDDVAVIYGVPTNDRDLELEEIFPRTGARFTRVEGRRPARLGPRAAAADEPRRRPFASLGPEGVPTAPGTRTVSYDPHAHSPAGLRPTGRPRRLRDTAHVGSRHGRTGGGHDGR
ncbi:hypothetical protein [Streptomyces sp. NPDC014676]|uniref:hypothetical protein n=1 Tax=Streptomyces sp. NPDC014676 TaxID=3364879 RepID=UPI0036F63E7A